MDLFFCDAAPAISFFCDGVTGVSNIGEGDGEGDLGCRDWRRRGGPGEFGGGGSGKGTVGLGIEASADELALDVSVPIILDLIVRSSG